MIKLYAATQNKHKIEEIKSVLEGKCEVLSVYDLNVTEELPETGATLTHNAMQKARYIHEKFGVDCFADDTGLEVDVLNGEPGVDSAYYAGPQKNADDNIALLLEKMQDKDNRKARFVTIIALIINNQEFIFEGLLEGEILQERQGNGGFGYDPVFRPSGYDKTFAEMSMIEKANISHRGRAIAEMSSFLNIKLD